MEIEQEPSLLLCGSWTDQEGSALHEGGSTETSFSVNWEIDLLAGEDGLPQLRLRRLDLVGQPIESPRGPTGLISLTSAPRIAEFIKLHYDLESGRFSAVIPMLVHCALADETPVFPDDPDSHEILPAQRAAMVCFEGQFHHRLTIEPEREVVMEAEIRGQVVLDEPDQDWEQVIPRNGLPNSGEEVRPPDLDPMFREALPLLRGFVVRAIGIGTPHAFPICETHAPLRRLSIQPVFVDSRDFYWWHDPPVRDLPRNPHLPGGPPVRDRAKISGKSFETVMQRARDIWKKACLDFDVLPPKVALQKDFFTLNTYLEASHFASSIKPDGKSILVFVADSWNVSGQTRPPGDPTPATVFRGGAYSAVGGSASAYILTVDSQINIPSSGPGSCGNGAKGPVNMNHLAHELGHVIGLNHPGVYTPAQGVLPAMYPSSKGSVMEPSGYCADNPSKNGRSNVLFMRNPLLRTTGYSCTSTEISDYVKPWWPII